MPIEKMAKLARLVTVSGVPNGLYEALDDFLIKAEKEEQWDFLLKPLQDLKDFVFEELIRRE